MFKFLGLTDAGLRGLYDGLFEFLAFEYPVNAANVHWFRGNAGSVFYHNPRNPSFYTFYTYERLKIMRELAYDRARREGKNLRAEGAEMIKQERVERAKQRAKTAAQAILAQQIDNQNRSVGISQ